MSGTIRERFTSSPTDRTSTQKSGTFQFDDEAGLKAVAAELRRQGLIVERGAVRFFPADGSRPVILE
jgi:hypothetical protein